MGIETNETLKLPFDYPLPDNIEIKETTAEITSEAGLFLMPKDMFFLYFESFRIKDIDDFHRHCLKFLSPDKYERDDNVNQIKKEIAEFADNQGLKLEDYVDGTGQRNDKTDELYNLLPKTIMDKIAFYWFNLKFSSSSSVNDTFSYLDHSYMGSSSSMFFNVPFMGGFHADKNWQDKTKEKREEFLKNPNKQALILFGGGDNSIYTKGIDDQYKFCDTENQKIKEQVKNYLEKIYETSGTKSVPFNQITSIRLVMHPVDFDDEMWAIPEPETLEFIANKNIVLAVSEPDLIKNLRPKKEDCLLADTIINKNGDKHWIAMETTEFTHTMNFIEETPNWYDRYLDRITK